YTNVIYLLIGEIYLFFVLNLDVIGFFLLAIGYFFNAKLNSERTGLYLFGALSFFGWFICRLLNQYILFLFQPLFEITDFRTFLRSMIPYMDWTQSYPTPSAVMLVLYILGSGFLAIGSILIARSEKVSRLFMVYGIMNFLAVLLQTFEPLEGVLSGEPEFSWFLMMLLGASMKGLLIPLLGVITFNASRRNHSTNEI
ncbi:MAG: hypothetical protein ACFFD4_23420, partial [Candidatus Odinarchaeota archaeon]